MSSLKHRLAVLAAGGALVVTAVFGIGQAASASTNIKPAYGTNVVQPLSYQNCMFRVSAPITIFVTGTTTQDLFSGDELYSTAAQSKSDNLWWLYSLKLNRYGWVDWHDLTLEYCD
jgi:hypothetical protein